MLQNKNPFPLPTFIFHWIKLENLVLQLKRYSVEAWQNEKHYSEVNNTSKNPNPKARNFQISWPCEVQRSGQATTFVVCAVFSLSIHTVVLLTKTSINHRSFKSSLRWVDGFKKFQRYWAKELFLYNRMEAFFWKFSSEVEKCIMWNSIQVLPNQVSKKSFYTFEDIDLWESHAKLHKTEWIPGSRFNLNVKNHYLLSSLEL